jgi:hypothetical protein
VLGKGSHYFQSMTRIICSFQVHLQTFLEMQQPTCDYVGGFKASKPRSFRKDNYERSTCNSDGKATMKADTEHGVD